MPIVRVGVGTEPDEMTRRKFVVDDVRVCQARNSEERRDLPMIAEGDTSAPTLVG